MSAFYDQASLVVVPSGYKAGKVYAQKPLTTDGQLSFTRSTGATRVGPNGLIEKVRTNLILQSEAFNVTWTPVRSSVTANTTTAPDGTSTADTLFDSVDNNIHYVRQSFTAITGPATISIYAKANQLSQIQLVAAGGTTPMGRGFDLSTGTTFVESIGGIISNDLGQSITAIGNGWYRCTMSWTSTGQNDFWILTSSANAATYAGTGTNGVFIWGAQLETGDIATDYIATTTAAVSVGPVANVPRLDYAPTLGQSGVSCPRLLLEPQRTNSVTYSEQIDNAAWIKTNVTVTANSATSPDGYTNADKLIANTTNAQHAISQSFSVVAGNAYTISAFVKSAEYTSVALRMGGGNLWTGGGGPTVRFNLLNQTGTIEDGTGVTFRIVDYGNGWYRCSVTGTCVTSGTSAAAVYPNEYQPFIGNNTSGLLVYGIQVETSATYATSYVKTEASAVTRLADAASKTGISSLIGQTEGTLFVEYTATSSDTTNATRIINVRNSGSSNQVYIQQNTTNSFTAVAFNGSNIFLGTTATGFAAAGTTYKIAFAYKDGSFAFYINGSQVAVSSATGLGTLSIDIVDLSTNVSKTNNISQALLFKTRLPNAQLAELTTL